MNKIFALALCTFFIIVFSQSDVRLIQFNATTIVKMTMKDVERLANQDGEEIHFADITDTPNLEKGTVPTPSQIPSEPRHQNIVTPLLSKLTVAGWVANLEKLSSYHTRYYQSETGKDAAVWIHSYYTNIIKSLPESRRNLFKVSYFNHSWVQPSVIVRIQGKSDEMVVVGAHEDSINGATGRSPGSDDNGSGTSCILEVFKAIAASNVTFGKTIEFHNYAAEEVGLRGSRDIANAYKNQQKKIFASINMDMIGFNNGQDTAGIATDNVDATLTNFLKKVVPAYSNLKTGEIRCNYACSDHHSFHVAGYRASHIFEAHPLSNMNRNIHTARDTIDRLDSKRAVEFLKVALAFAVELAL